MPTGPLSIVNFGILRDLVITTICMAFRMVIYYQILTYLQNHEFHNLVEVHHFKGF